MLNALAKAQAVAKRLASERPSGYSHKKKPSIQPKAPQPADQSSFTDSILVPSFFPSLLQAHRSEYCKWIQEETGASLTTDPSPSLEDNLKRIILQSKDQKYLEAAKALIQRELEGKIFDQYPIPANKMGTLIGKGGETIKGLQDRAQGCRIWVSNPSSHELEVQQQASSERMVSLFGSEEEIEKAKLLVNQVVFGAQSGDVVAVYQIPDYSCSGLIGKRAENIKMLQQSTGASMFLDNAVGKAMRLVYVTGTPAAVSAAFKALQDQLGLGVVVDVSASKKLPSLHSEVEIEEAEVEAVAEPAASPQQPQTVEEYQQAMAAYYAACYAQNPAYAAYCQQYYSQYYGEGGAS